MTAEQLSLGKPKKNPNVVSVSTTLPIEVWQEIKDAGHQYNTLIIAGLRRTDGMPKVLQRLKESEENNTKLVEKVQKLGIRLNEQNVAIMRLERGK
jgi:hypothetical protein